MAGRLQALLLDAVGTLIRLREPPHRVYQRVAARNGIELDSVQTNARLSAKLAVFRPPCVTGVQLQQIPELEREGWREIVREVMGSAAADGPCFEELFEVYGRPETWCSVTAATGALELARGQGLHLAVVSNMDARLPRILEGLGLNVDTVVMPSNTGFTKADARIFQIALQRLDSDASAALYIGDRERDCVQAARGAGLRTLRYDPGGSPDNPELLISWRQLAPQLLRLAG